MNTYQHDHGCNWLTKHPDFRDVGADGVPRVLALDPTTGATISEPCACFVARGVAVEHFIAAAQSWRDDLLVDPVRTQALRGERPNHEPH